jgi:hypothetical protein
MEIYKPHIETSFKNAENNISKITEDIINVDCMCGTKTKHFYNNLLNMKDARYLEIGTWKGGSVCAAMYKNEAKIVCIDNWSEFGGPKFEFLTNFEKFKGKNDATFIETSCYEMNVSKLPKFNIYMYDGKQTEENVYKALIYYYNCLDNVFIFVIGDWNSKFIREETRSAIKNLNLEILYEKEIINEPYRPFYLNDWWNGIFVTILQKNSKLLFI